MSLLFVPRTRENFKSDERGPKGPVLQGAMQSCGRRATLGAASDVSEAIAWIDDSRSASRPTGASDTQFHDPLYG